MARLAPAEVKALDPYKFMATIGKRVIHPGGRESTEALLSRAGITSTSRVLDVGCGVGTTAIEIARRFGAAVTAVDISPLMLERAAANVRAARAADRVTVAPADVLGQVCPGMLFDTAEDWVGIYQAAGLVNVEAESGPFAMMTARGFLADEGPARSLAIMTAVAARPANIRKMAWLMPRMSKAVPYLGYVLIASEKPR